jgi:hypothetical protein
MGIKVVDGITNHLNGIWVDIERKKQMINNRKAYKIFMGLSDVERKKLSVKYEIEQIENFNNKKWNNRFSYFWNWLWMKHFKNKNKNKEKK